MKRIVVIKVGTSTLTVDGGPLDSPYIADLAAQVAKLRADGLSVIIVTSGAIGAGMDTLKLSGRPRSIPQKQAAAAVGQGVLINSYATAFATHGISVGQVLLTREDLRERVRYLNARNTFTALLQFGVIPIVNENDTVAVDEIRFGDNDTLSALVAALVEADSLVLLTDVGGLYDKDPTAHPDAQLIPVVEKIDRSVELRAGGSRTVVGTGGMATKIQAAKICANTGVRMTIASGRRPNVLHDALAGKCGTLFLPKAIGLRSRQRWIAYGVVPRGTLVVNEGARLRMVEEGKSLLPAGIVDVSGQFREGELVRIDDCDGNTFAQGFVNYASDQLAQIKGCRTRDIASILGSKPSDEAVHRDNLVLNL